MRKLPEGWSTGTIQDFLDLTDEQMQEIEDAVDLAIARARMADDDDERVPWDEVRKRLGLDDE